jgi:hypothetical protein
MGDIPTAAEQEAKMAARKQEEAEERVARREKLGQQVVSEPVLDQD